MLTGTLPLEATYHTRKFSLFGAIQRLVEDHSLRRLAERQLAVGTRHSWFVLVRQLLETYGLDLPILWNSAWTKLSWKHTIKTAVRSYWFSALITGAASRTSLQHLDPSSIKQDTPHIIWSSCKGSVRQVRMAGIRAKMLIGVYTLQTSKHTLEDDPNTLCPLCKSHEETLAHFLLYCPAQKTCREPLIKDLVTILKNVNI